MPNGFEIIGQGLRQTAGDLGAFSDRQQQYQEMVQRRVMAMQEQKRQEEEARVRQEQADREKQKYEADQARVQVEQQEKDRQQKAKADFLKFQQGEQKAKGPAPAPKPYLAPGMGPQGEASFQPPQEMEMVRPTRDQMQRKAMELDLYGDPGVRAYFDDTNPTKTPEFQKEILGLKSDAAQKASAERMKYMAAMDEYRQGRIDARTVMGLKAAMERAEMSDKSKPKTESGMPLKALGETELNTLKNIQNTAYSIQKIKALANNISDLKRGPIAGRIFGKNPYDTDLQALDRLVNQTVPGMARGVFGEVGVLTDADVNRYSKMLSSVKDDPSLARQIIDDLQDKIDSAYKISVDTYNQGGRDVSGFNPDWTSRTPSSSRPAPRPTGQTEGGPKEGDTKTNSNGRQVIYRGGRWVAA